MTLAPKDLTEWAKGYFHAYETGDRAFIADNMAPGFTFTSPFDDHIGREAYFARCWPHADIRRRFDFVAVMQAGAGRPGAGPPGGYWGPAGAARARPPGSAVFLPRQGRAGVGHRAPGEPAPPEGGRGPNGPGRTDDLRGRQAEKRGGLFRRSAGRPVPP